MRFVCGLDGLRLGEGETTREVTITRTGSFTDPRYGRFEITREMLLAMVRNFDARTYGQDIFIDVAHKPSDGAAAKVLALKVDGNRLRAVAEFTPFGVEAVKNRGFRYLSAEFVDDYVDNEGGKSHGPTLLGAGLTVRPVIKRLDPVTLSSEAHQGPVFLHPELVRQLSESLEQTTMKWLDSLRAKLRALKLSEVVIESLTRAAETAAKSLGEDDPALKALAEQFEAAGKQLAESGAGNGNTPIEIKIETATAAKTLSADDVGKLLDEREAARAESVKKFEETKAARVKLFNETIDAAKGLSETTVAELKKAGELITAGMTEDQVRALATQQLSLGNQLEASRQLSGMGFTRQGSPHITVDESNAIKQLSESVRKGLAQTAHGMSGQLRLSEPAKHTPFVQKLLGEFDRHNADRLHAEAKVLSGGTVNIGDMSLPASYQRQVIEETYQDTNILQLVNTNVDITASATHNIPYETRVTAGVTNDAVTYEGQPIQQAGVSQANALAYITPMKLALELTNEAIWFSRNNPAINFDAWARNIASNARLMRELIARRIANRMQRDSDAYGAVTVAAGGATTTYTGATNGYKTANFPVVRPLQIRDLQGNAVGSVMNPITFKDGATILAEYDGTNTQTAGKYYRVISYNLGLFQVVSELGAPTAPAGTVTIGYDYASNIIKVDTDPASGLTYEQQMNKLLQKIGERKAMLAGDRYVKAEFALMSPSLHNMATDAEQFTSSGSRADSGITSTGDLTPIKGLAPVETNAPAIDLGDERIIVGERGTLSYTVAKVFSIGDPVERVDSNAKFLGKKGAYGEEYSSLVIPTPLRNRLTSVIAYSVTTGRGS